MDFKFAEFVVREGAFAPRRSAMAQERVAYLQMLARCIGVLWQVYAGVKSQKADAITAFDNQAALEVVMSDVEYGSSGVLAAVTLHWQVAKYAAAWFKAHIGNTASEHLAVMTEPRFRMLNVAVREFG